jgi:hypothetical protein
MIERIIPPTDSVYEQGNALCKPIWCGIAKIEGFAGTEEQPQVIGQELSPPIGYQWCS